MLNDDEFQPEILLKHIHKLPLDSFEDFMKTTKDRISNNILTALKRCWLKGNSTKENYEKLIFGSDMEGVLEVDKYKLLRNVVKQFDGDFSKRMEEFLFPEDVVSEKIETGIVEAVKFFEPTDEKLKTIADNAENIDLKVSVQAIQPEIIEVSNSLEWIECTQLLLLIFRLFLLLSYSTFTHI